MTINNKSALPGTNNPGKLPNQMREIRCASCNRLLAKGRIMVISVKCPRCKAINIISDNQE